MIVKEKLPLVRLTQQFCQASHDDTAELINSVSGVRSVHLILSQQQQKQGKLNKKHRYTGHATALARHHIR